MDRHDTPVTDPVIGWGAAAPSAFEFRTAQVAIIVPTFNERENIAGVVAAINAALPDIAWEVVFVDDDSPDETAAEVRAFAQRDPRVRCLQRIGRRGLSTACIEGMLATSAPLIAVMDADRQHDERALRAMIDKLQDPTVDLVIGTRYAAGGGLGDWDEKREAMSRFATKLANYLTKTPLSDPMSGFFMIRREAFMRSLPDLSAVGFKILLDLAASAPVPLHVAEVPYEFRSREFGESKLDSVVLWEYLLLLLDRAIGHIVPVRFISFALVGGTGVFVSMAILVVLFKGFRMEFGESQTIATVIAISTNFLLNNALTYRDRRLKGIRIVWGWLTFNAVSAVGAIGNVGIASYMFNLYYWSWFLSALAGIAVGVVWNYAASSFVTWRKR